MSVAGVLRDGRVIARRNMLGVRRTPGALVTGVPGCDTSMTAKAMA